MILLFILYYFIIYIILFYYLYYIILLFILYIFLIIFKIIKKNTITLIQKNKYIKNNYLIIFRFFIFIFLKSFFF